MSLNWVSVQSSIRQPFTLLPTEQLLHSQEERITIRLEAIGQPNPESIVIKGHVYLTTHRLVVLSDNSIRQQTENQSFALHYVDVVNHRMKIPWFGCNRYEISFRISDGRGGLNYMYVWKGSLEFQYGGAPAFAEKFEQAALDSKRQEREGEDLPAYEA